jgi:CBS domain-containing protein
LNNKYSSDNASDVVSNYTVNAGAYAVVGAASMLGGVTHMVISLTVIVVECTDGLNLALPIMFALYVAKWTASRCGHGLYDLYIEEKHIGFLEWAAPKYFHQLLTQDVMKPKPVCLRQVENVGRIYKILKDNSFAGFPVILAPKGHPSADAVLAPEDTIPGTLAGIILRNQLQVLLSERGIDIVRWPQERKPPQTPNRGSTLYEKFLTQKHKLISWATIEKTYPRYPSTKSINLTETQLNSWIDLSPYVGIPYTAKPHAPLMRTFRVFRHLGLRHLIVTDTTAECEAVGIITRKVLDHDYTHKVLESIYGTHDGSHQHRKSDAVNAFVRAKMQSTDPTANLKPVTNMDLLQGNSVGESGMEMRSSARSTVIGSGSDYDDVRDDDNICEEQSLLKSYDEVDSQVDEEKASNDPYLCI